MEGKNCFRTKWMQQPIFSGGNIATIALPATASTATELADAHANRDFEEGIVAACGDTVNVMRASTGELLCAYTLPVEDVILRIDAVSVAPRSEAHRAIKQEQESGSEVASGARHTKKDKLKRKRQDAESHLGTEVKREAAEAEVEAEADELTVPPGAYVAVSTRSLQIYLLRVDVAPAVPLPRAAPDAGGEADAGREAPPQAVAAPRLSFNLHQIKSWTAAQQAISAIYFSEDGRYLISGSTDGGVKVWDAFHHHLTHNLRCPHAGVVQTLYLDTGARYLAVGSFEGHITLFDFASKRIYASARPHVQAVEAITLSADGHHLFSIGRDRRLAVLLLDAENGELPEKRAVVVKEHVSSAVFEDATTLHIGAMDGAVATYQVHESEALRILRRLPPPPAASAEEDATESFVCSIAVAMKPKGTTRIAPAGWVVMEHHDSQASPLYVADAGFNIACVQPAAGATAYRVTNTLVGFLDQILQVEVFPNGCPYQRVVVNNSRDVRLYGAVGCLSSQTLRGHTDIVLSCAVSADGSIIATAGKDREVRFWSSTTWRTVAKGVRGHTGEITSICFNAKQTPSYLLLFSISSDENLRMWDAGQSVLPAMSHGGAHDEVVEFEQRAGINAAHAGPVYALAVAPNDQYVATGGKDKAIHLWTLTGKKLYRDAVLKGHRRGVSALQFSPADRVLASASNDGSVRLWSLVSLMCVKTLQTDRTPVLQLAFFNSGSQIVTGNAEGVLRVWAVAVSEAVWSSELHDEKIWALRVLEDDATTVFLSGSADGVLIATEDYTAEEVERVREDRHDVILKEQALANAMRKGEYSAAFMLALQLNHPRHLRQVLVKWSVKNTAECEETLRRELLPRLNEEQVVRLLQFTREWTTNSRHSAVASLVIHSFLASYHFYDLAKLPSMPDLVAPLLAYTQKHSQRLHGLLQRTYYIDYVTRSLAPNALTSLPPFLEPSNGNSNSPADIPESHDAKRIRTQ